MFLIGTCGSSAAVVRSIRPLIIWERTDGHMGLPIIIMRSEFIYFSWSSLKDQLFQLLNIFINILFSNHARPYSSNAASVG
jgi:hypothetical protein